MLDNYEEMVRKCYAPLIEKYHFEFVPFDKDGFFMIGDGFALYTFIDRRDRYGDTWYISLSRDGVIREHTLMYIDDERMTKEDRAVGGDPNAIKTVDDYIEGSFCIICAFLMNRCVDILTGDTAWLQNYPDQGDYDSNVAKFLAPYFEKQGRHVNLQEK